MHWALVLGNRSVGSIVIDSSTALCACSFLASREEKNFFMAPAFYYFILINSNSNALLFATQPLLHSRSGSQLSQRLSEIRYDLGREQ